MNKFLFIVLGPADNIIWCLGENNCSGMMKTAHDLVDEFRICGADHCQIWAQSGRDTMLLLATAF